ncbi:MAG: SpoIIE family protein phosphatase [Pseudomonadota bacterium]
MSSNQKANERVVSFLSASPFFKGLPKHLLRRVAGDMSVRELRLGETLFSRGEPGDAAYLVSSGQMHLESGGVTLVSRGVGEFIGEFALVDDGPRSATAVAETDAILLRWPRDAFVQSLTQQPQVATSVFRLLTSKLREDIFVQVEYGLEQAKWRLELERAQQIQTDLLPGDELANEFIEIAAHCEQMDGVGGDFYDFIDAGPNRLGIVIADVTGHGLNAALVVAMAKSCLHNQIMHDASPTAVLSALQATLGLSTQRRILMSCAFLSFDFAARKATFANAGHPFPLSFNRRDETIERLWALDPILGAVDLPSFESIDVSADLGNIWVMYSDGLPEARNSDRDMWGIEPVEALVQAYHHESARDIRDRILEAHHRYVGDRADDDATLVVAKLREGV